MFLVEQSGKSDNLESQNSSDELLIFIGYDKNLQ